jgi:hypothetical protein
VTRKPTPDVLVASGNSPGDGGFGFFFQPNWGSQPVDPRRRGGQYYRPVQQPWW